MVEKIKGWVTKVFGKAKRGRGAGMGGALVKSRYLTNIIQGYIHLIK